MTARIIVICFYIVTSYMVYAEKIHSDSINFVIKAENSICVNDTAVNDGVLNDTILNERQISSYKQFEKQYTFRPTQLIAPGILMGAGIAGVYSLHDFKNSIRDNFSGYKKGHTFKADDYIQYSTALGYLGLGFIPGIKTRSHLRQRVMAGVTAYAIMAVAVNAMKYSLRHPRPGSGTRNSFPSGHSATVFTGAELMRIEYGNYIGIAGYVIAVTVGALRIYNDRHWITDVFGGAAIGIISARAGYWLIPLEQKLFKLDKKQEQKHDLSLSVIPMIGYSNGLAMSIQF